jgi:cyclic pyranopterin phosphate synthase
LPRLSHVDARGRARMVDVGAKPETRRVAVAEGRVALSREGLPSRAPPRDVQGRRPRGREARRIQGAKETSRLVPLCHPIPLDVIHVELKLEPRTRTVRIEARSRRAPRRESRWRRWRRCRSAALTVYDMCKAVDRGITIGEVRLLAKSGGRSGPWRRDAEAAPSGTEGRTRKARARGTARDGVRKRPRRA